MIKELKWDSDNFHIKVGTCFCTEINTSDFETIQKEAKKNKFDLVYIKTNVSSTVLSDCNLFCDERIVYVKNISPSDIMNSRSLNKFIMSYKHQSLSEEMIDLSLSSGKYSRFNLDPRFPSQSFQDLYYNWIYNSINTDFALDVLVYIDNEHPVGLLTYDINSDISTIGIIAVNEEYRGKHIGSALLEHYYSILPLSVNRLTVVTQGANTVARKFYERNGYIIDDISYTYHYWVD